MTQQHPITPPPELIEDWIEIAKPEPWERPPDPNVLCTLAAQWGADKELEACCKWLPKLPPWSGEDLQRHRRPKPPSLKEQALDELDRIPTHDSEGRSVGVDVSILRRALEQLPDSLIVFPSQC